MAEYIDKEKLLQKLSRMIEYCKNDNKLNGLTALFQVGDAIMDCPTADVQEVRHGRWISNELGGYKWAYYCSECSWVDGYPFNDRHKYCPNCGARMDGDEK